MKTAKRVNWTKLARPQNDGSDTEQLKRMLESSSSITNFKPEKGQRVLTDVYFNEQVSSVSPGKNIDFEGLYKARLNHKNIKQAELLLQQCWPEIHNQFGKLIKYLCPMLHKKQGHILQSCSGCFDEQFGLIYTTVEHPYSLAEALVHELAHHKLFALGLGIESSKTLIKNPVSKLYKSPVILDRRRPMSAVLHAQYSFIHILQFDLNLYNILKTSDEKTLALSLIDYTLPKMIKGMHEIKRHAKLDSRGESWMKGFMYWSEEVIHQASEIYKKAA